MCFASRYRGPGDVRMPLPGPDSVLRRFNGASPGEYRASINEPGDLRSPGFPSCSYHVPEVCGVGRLGRHA